VPYRDELMRTTVPNIFVAGDVAGVEEASSAMVTGRLAGLSAAEYLDIDVIAMQAKKEDCFAQLASLRHGHGGRILEGIKQASL